MERDAKYATVAMFALACIAVAVAFIWWYSGRGDRRDYDTYEIYFEGTVSGLSKGSPVRYLGVDVGRVLQLGVDRRDPRRVKVIADIDSSAPISGATLANLGLLGLTGLLYIDLQVDPAVPKERPLPQGESHPVIASRKGTIELSIERLPQILNEAAEIMSRIERVLNDDNLRAVGDTLASIRDASATLPETLEDARAVAADLRRVSDSTLALTTSANRLLEQSQPEVAALLANARTAAEKLSHTADGLDRLLNDGDGALGRSAGSSVAELHQLVVDARSASDEVRELARELRERPSSLLRETPESGVELRP